MIRMMLISLLALAVVGCTDGTAQPDPTERRDAGTDSADTTSPDAGDPDASDTDTTDTTDTDHGDPQADVGDTDTTDDCACEDADSPCCDGCEATNVGEECDDGLDCTLGTVCTDDGVCGDPDGSPCDDEVEHPDCMAAECDETEGCSYEPIREDLDCTADGIQPGTGQCDDGKCVGTPCECDTDDECCDGCMGINEGEACDGVDYGMHCDSGECVEAPCNCDNTDDPCCDGCHWTEGEVCGSTVERSCIESGLCGGDYERVMCDQICQSEDDYECSRLNEQCETETASCDDHLECDTSGGGTGICYNSASC